MISIKWSLFLAYTIINEKEVNAFMEIKSIYDIQKRLAVPSSRSTHVKIEESISVRKEPVNLDTINISPNASFQSKLDMETKKYSALAKQSPTTSSERISQIKAQYQGDCCPISGSDVASAILNQVYGYQHS